MRNLQQVVALHLSCGCGRLGFTGSWDQSLYNISRWVSLFLILNMQQVAALNLHCGWAGCPSLTAQPILDTH